MIEYITLDLSLIIFFTSAIVLWLRKRRLGLSTEWINTVSIVAICFFISLAFYIALRVMAPAISITPDSWLTFPATILAIWIWYDKVLRMVTGTLDRNKDKNNS